MPSVKDVKEGLLLSRNLGISNELALVECVWTQTVSAGFDLTHRNKEEKRKSHFIHDA